MSKKYELKSKETKTILKYAKENNIEIKSFCNIGVCGKCTVKVLEGQVSKPNARERRKLGEDRLKEGYRLACQTKFSKKVIIEA
ncbi:2Fe-2S iron-sulfur cluster binding domain-containing protein [Acidaminobacter sp. JC074]|uniref:2Fe-2S iron-sulfur cluster-binding protein n=1 Tax=Acidaminobacter sp. JC074 TaxID=2530199 RepID=UPI001F0F7042|nr:2Fe-2S iron-sulfur cluster binding domain-containing protein [Acidaminobacter sp. JC074]MCH4886472.1 2Fe-2S iron-sulfur cluster binding domain-containing protein [Acidaminobacter sp. JC074]